MIKIKNKPVSLTIRLVMVAFLWSVAVILVTGIGLVKIFGNSVDKSFEGTISVYIDALAAGVNINKGGMLQIDRPPTDPRFSRPLSGHYWTVADVENNKVSLSRQIRSQSLFDEAISLPESVIKDSIDKRGDNVFYDTDRNGEDLKIGIRAVTLPERNVNTLLIVAFDRSDVVKSKKRFNLVVAGSLGVLVLGLMTAIMMQVRLGLQPLRQMGNQLGRIRSGSLDKLNEDLPREIAPIAREMNALLQHNEEVVDRARTHVGNLAHALKTPISVMLNEANGHDDSFGKLVSRQSQNMQRQVEHYLKRARAAARAETLRSRTLVLPVVEDIVRTLAKLYKKEGVLVELIGTTKQSFRGEREDLEDLIGNITENACKYGGGLVEVTFEETNIGFINILIDDDGEGLTEVEVKAALKRGVRLDETSHGSGLGLSICKELALAYGGDLVFSTSPLGGLRVKVSLPTADI